MIQKSLLQKIVMAVTGIILFLFVLGHGLGNISLFCGRESINAYAAHIHGLGPLLWLERIVLCLAFGFHIYIGIRLSLENWRARPTGYVVRKYQRSNLASRTMIYTGIIILLFLIYHLLHFTFQITNPEISKIIDNMGRNDVYAMLVLNFKQGLIALTYILAMLALLLHLYHGILSFFQTLGLNNERSITIVGRVGKCLAGIVFVGFISLPVAVFLGIVAI